MEPYYADDAVTLWHGDSLEVMRRMPAASVDAVVTDPPYSLGFMGRAWDTHDTPAAFADWCRAWALEAYRVLKPGGHLLAFGGTRTWHRLACGIEDAGFEIRDTITWMYGSGFPKSLDVSKAIDRQRDDSADVERVRRYLESARVASGLTRRAVAESFAVNSRMVQKWMGAVDDPQGHCPTWERWQRLRELIGFGDEMDAEVWRLNGRKGTPGEAWQNAEVLRTETRAHAPSGLVGVGQEVRKTHGTREIKAPHLDDAKRWHGWGTALKPASEPIVVARKPLAGTVAQTVQAHGTGALNIGGCRVAGMDAPTGRLRHGGGSAISGSMSGPLNPNVRPESPAGRWPSNVVLSHVPLYAEEHDRIEIVGDACANGCVPGCPVAELDAQSGVLTSGYMKPETNRATRQGDAYGQFSARTATATYGDSGSASRFFPTFRYEAKAPSSERPRDGDVAHPTVKPLDLMRWLVRLVTPPGGLVLDPFAGSGTTAEACVLEGFRCHLIELEAAHLPLIVKRLAKPLQLGLFSSQEDD